MFVETDAGNLAKLLRNIAGPAVFWIMPLARLMMCALIFLAIAGGGEREFYPTVSVILAYSWIGWAVTTFAAAVAGQPVHLPLCRLVVIADAILAVISMALLKGMEGATIAFALCVTVFAMEVRVGRNVVFASFMISPIAFVLRDGVALLTGKLPARVFDPSVGTELLTAGLQISAIAALIIWGNRRYQLEKFSNDFSSLRMLSLERSFEFDLQGWITAFANLYSPERAGCLMAAPSKVASNRYYHHNFEAWGVAKDQDELLAAFRQLPEGCSIFDCELNRIVCPGSRMPRPFNEVEQKLALLLHRSNISIAFVQPMQIDRSRGGMICAVRRPVDASLIAESFHLGRHVCEMEGFLSRIATAERNFIADAHDIARRDLHDGVLQSLAALRMRLLIIAKRKDIAAPGQSEIRKAVDILTLEQSRLRGLLEISHRADNMVNLASQLDLCVRGISLQWDIDVSLKSDEPAIPVDAESAMNIEHLVREVIANAVRHAKSKSLTVSLSLKQDALMMAVIDRNPSPEGEQGESKPALTLKSASLRHRLRLVSGEAYAEGLGYGTLLSVRIPMQQVDDA